MYLKLRNCCNLEQKILDVSGKSFQRKKLKKRKIKIKIKILWLLRWPSQWNFPEYCGDSRSPKFSYRGS